MEPLNGIFGILSREIDDTEVDAMSRALSTSGTESRRRFAGIALGARSQAGKQAGIAETMAHGAPLVVAIHGNLFAASAESSGRRDQPLAEQLLEAYLREGARFLERLRGEFAVAVWDGARNALYLATDRFKVHPLLYYWDGSRLIFASRMRSLLACPSVKTSIDAEAVVDVVGSSVIYSPRTIFREVRKIPAGYVLEHRGGDVRTRAYWDVEFRPRREAEATLATTLKTEFDEAVGIRLRHDAPLNHVGTFLSGGIDSSTVTGVVATLAGRPLPAFSVGFAEEGFNEIEYARISARHFKTDHAEYFVTPEDVRKALPIILEAFDEPFANASAVPTYYCARLARSRGVDVMYAGDGGDELFAGNERYATQRLFDYYGLLPNWTRRRIVGPLVTMGERLSGWWALEKAKKYIRRAEIPYPDRIYSYAFFAETPLATLLDDELLEAVGRAYDPYAVLREHYFRAPASAELDRQMYVDLKMAIADNDVLKVSRMGEAAGVTVRYPFLDHPFVEFAASVPASLKMRGRRLRTFFKGAYRQLLHPDTLTKQKHGFGLPIAQWLRTDRQLNEMMHELVLSPRAVQRGYVRRSAVEEIVRSHRSDSSSFYGSILWNLMILEAWHRAAGR